MHLCCSLNLEQQIPDWKPRLFIHPFSKLSVWSQGGLKPIQAHEASGGVQPGQVVSLSAVTPALRSTLRSPAHCTCMTADCGSTWRKPQRKNMQNRCRNPRNPLHWEATIQTNDWLTLWDCWSGRIYEIYLLTDFSFNLTMINVRSSQMRSCGCLYYWADTDCIHGFLISRCWNLTGWR